MLQLKNQTFTLTHNGAPIAELSFNGEGRPELGPGFNPASVRLFLAVMTLIIGEYPTSEKLSEIILEVRPVPRKPRTRLPLNIE